MQEVYFLIDLFRKAQREKHAQVSLDQLEEQGSQEITPLLHQKRLQEEQRSDLEECEQEALRAIWLGDPDRTRKIQALHLNSKLGGWTQADVAQRFGVSTSKVNRWVNSGKAQLLQELEKRCPEFGIGQQASPGQRPDDNSSDEERPT